MSKKISYSAYKRYHTCPKSYYYHYVERLRTNCTSSNLLFGSAIDEALNEWLMKDADPNVVFYNAFTRFDMNGKEYNINLSTNVVWNPEDYDKYLLSESNKNIILNNAVKLGYTGTDIDGLIASLLDTMKTNGLNGLTDNQKRVVSFACTISMTEKARHMFKSYAKWIKPQLTKVEQVQIELDHPFINGIVDLIAEVKGHGRVLLDHKTSKFAYKPDAATYDPQLLLYASILGCDKVGFITLVKNINKNKTKECAKCGYNGTGGRYSSCPEVKGGVRCRGSWEETVRPLAYVQLIVSDIKNKNLELPKQALCDTLKAIKDEHFPRNLNACNNQYGKPCPYLKKCWENKEDNLITVKERNK